MRHRSSTRKLGRTTAHRRAMLGNMATSLFRANAVVTTTPKARVLRSVAEKLITLGKRGDLHARRLASRSIKDRQVLKKLFEEIAPQYATRQGGYTRVMKLGQRRGDGASLARLELLMPAPKTGSKEDGKKAAKGRKKTASRKTKAAKSEADESSE